MYYYAWMMILTVSQHVICFQLCELLPKASRDWRYQIESAERDVRRIILTMSRIGVSIGAIQTIGMMTTDKRRNGVIYLLSSSPYVLFTFMCIFIAYHIAFGDAIV